MTVGVFAARIGDAPARRGRAWRFLLVPGLLLPMAMPGCAQPGAGGTPSPADQVARRFLQFSPRTEDGTQSKPRKWVGRGYRDTCGNPWVIEIRLIDDLVFGTFWRGAIKYDISGNLKPSGNMERVLGSKNRFFQHRVGPRLMEFNVTFGDGVARGEHYFGNGFCLTPMRLVPDGN